MINKTLDTATAMKFHLMAAAFTGTVKHLIEAHQVPVEMLDSRDEDPYGALADHAWLHGWTFRDDGSIIRRKQHA